jgi:hypothetical protein
MPDDAKFATEESLRPEACALAVALPVSVAELEEDLAVGDREFARDIVVPEGPDATARGAWDHGYGAFVAGLAGHLQDIARLGVTVVEHARLDEVKQLFTSFRLVSLLAHGPFPLLSRGDVLQPAALLAALRGLPAGPSDNAVLERLLEDPDVRAARSVNEAVRELNRLLRRTRQHFHEGAFGEIDPRAWLTRMLLFEAFPGVFRPPTIIELRDGCHDFCAFCSIVPEDFSGNIEFLVCSGLWFSEALHRRRRRCGRILCPMHLVWASERIELYKVGIGLLKQLPMRYIDVYNLIHEAGLV